MAQNQGTGGGEGLASAEENRIPVMQSVLDNPFLLLFIGVAIPAVSYLIWGIMDIVLIPISK